MKQNPLNTMPNNEWETSELKRIIQVNKTYKELYPIFNEAFNSTLLPPVWCESCIKNCI